MEVKDASDVKEAASAVEAPAAKPVAKATAKKKAPVRRKKSTATKQRPKQAAKPVAPPPPPLTIKELKEQGAQAKQELVNAVIEPALEAAGSLSQTIRDTIGGAFAGLLSRKRRD
jgi:hypothetical protein|tara:strand:- start:9 stop:353 length:345 start_codon:yes stop_codon:yes gene_type:complete